MTNSITLIPTTEAREMMEKQLGISIALPTMIAWIRKYRLGKKVGGRWYCFEHKLEEFISHSKEENKEGNDRNNGEKTETTT